MGQATVGSGAAEARLDFATAAEAAAFRAAAAPAAAPPPPLDVLDANRPAVQRYVCELLVDPKFEKLVLSPREYVSDESRRRRGCDVDIPSRGDAAAATWIYCGDESRRTPRVRRG